MNGFSIYVYFSKVPSHLSDISGCGCFVDYFSVNLLNAFAPFVRASHLFVNVFLVSNVFDDVVGSEELLGILIGNLETFDQGIDKNR